GPPRQPGRTFPCDECSRQRSLPLAAEAGVKACETAMLTLGGYGYAKEYQVERLLREAMILRLAPVTPQLILCHIAEKVLGLPKSY
ncbi:MAG: acyl-CoA dehydrogenase family protein, partial [Stellaceae bacterium]